MQIELKRIQREVGITFVYVTHDQGEALTMSDRIAVMNDGQVEQLGTPREIYERPATKFVAGFIGTSNLLSGTVDRITSGFAVLRLGGRTGSLVAGRRRTGPETRSPSRYGRRRSRISTDDRRATSASCAAPSPRSSISASTTATR